LVFFVATLFAQQNVTIFLLAADRTLGSKDASHRVHAT
jgi:hypothetical protein